MLNANRSRERGNLVSWGLPAAVAVLGGISLYGLVNLSHERSRAQELSAQNQALNASLQQVQSQMQSVSAKLSALASQPVPAPVPPVESARPPASRPKTRAAVSRTPPRTAAEEARLRQLESNLATQQKELADARQQVDQNRQDLENKLSSSHDELSGSIAKNHDELMDLEKRGERSYYEFDLSKSKEFQHVGPLSLSVRRVNLKHKYYDLTLTVDDQQLEKKHVNLYEPLMFTVADRPQPIELVVNSIADNEVKGYVSEPKYKKSELASTSPAPPAQADTKGLQRR